MKKGIIIGGSIIVVIAIAVAVVLVLRAGLLSKDKATNNSKGEMTYNQLNDVTTLPDFSSSPKEQNGWTSQATADEANFVSNQFVNTNGCTFTMTSQQSPYPKKASDYDLSKSFASTIAATEQGTLKDAQNIKVNSSRGEVDFYAGTYDPKVTLTHPNGTTPSTTGGSTSATDRTTYLAVRTIGSSLKSTGDVTPSADESHYKQGEIVTSNTLIPTVTLKYSCASNVFSVNDAMAIIKQVTLNFNTNNKTPVNPAATGK